MKKIIPGGAPAATGPLEATMYLIKPEGMRYSHLIRSQIQIKGLLVEARRTLEINTFFLQNIYKHISPVLMDEVAHQMLCKSCEIGYITGKDVIARLRRVIGEHDNPALCESGTIRNLFGSNTSISINGETLWLNYVDYPQNAEQTLEWIRFFHFNELTTGQEST